MSEHTPGPWVLEALPTSCGICHKIGPFPGKNPHDSNRYAFLYCDYPSKSNKGDEELKANAKLISAAPELLEELKNCVAMLIELGACHLDHKSEKFRKTVFDYAKKGGDVIQKAKGADNE